MTADKENEDIIGRVRRLLKKHKKYMEKQKIWLID